MSRQGIDRDASVRRPDHAHDMMSRIGDPKTPQCDPLPERYVPD